MRLKLSRWLADCIGTPVSVHLKTGDTADGYLVETGREFIVLRQTRLHPAEGDSVSAAGELVIHESNVRFMQVLTDLPS